MRLHVVSLPHTQVTRAFSCCAYTQKVRKFCRMMQAEGHSVTLYAGDESDARVDELVSCVSEAERVAIVGSSPYVEASFDPEAPHWRAFNARAIDALRDRLEPHDLLCLIGGIAQAPIAAAFPSAMVVEYGIGYGGTFAPFRVFESHAWMHTVLGAQSNGDPHSIDGRWFDTVIPNYFEVEDFPFETHKEDYYLYLGRMIERKGVQIAADACERMGARLVMAGPGNVVPEYGEYIGVLGPEERGKWLSKAKAVFVPTQYIEPFGGVAVEAMLCGTPVLTSDWGAFPETVVQCVTGFRCHTLNEFVTGAKLTSTLSPWQIRQHALRYTLDRVGPQYDTYFARLAQLWDKGWYA